MSMAFEPYKRQAGHPPSETPTFRISPDRRIMSLNTKAVELMGDAPYVTLLFDEETRQMALEPTTVAGDYAFALNRSGKNKSRATLGIAGFAEKHRIEGAQTITATPSTTGRLLIADVGPAIVDSD